jgi:endonuclease/exonuclease/phosphatase family metal-dependent hydrolase
MLIQDQQDCGNMRIVSYNILDGGVGRADPLAEVVQAQNPDIVVLVEADDPAVIERIASRLKMDAARADGKKHGAAILSRWPIVESINHSRLHDQFADCVFEATIRDPNSREWPIAAVHFHPRATEEAENRREMEIDALMQIYAAHRKENRPHLLAGDFNANSPDQKIVPENCKPRTQKEIAENGGTLPRRAVTKLFENGYSDSLVAAHGKAAGEMGSFTTQYPGQRVDYIFTFGIDRNRFSEARVEQDRLAQFASDHYPVVLQVD